MQKLLAAVVLCAVSAGSFAQSRIDGLTFSVTTDINFNDPVPFGYVTPGAATAGMYGNQAEWVAGRSEFDLGGQHAAQSVLLSFTFANASHPRGPVPNGASVRLSSYIGDNVAALQDFRPTGFAALSTLDVSTLAGFTVETFDVTSLFNTAVGRGDAAFGIALDQRATPDVFANFRDFTLVVTSVPEPASFALMLGGIGLLAVVRRYRQQRS